MENKIIVTVSREFGTSGRQIAVKLGALLGVNVYDRRLLEQLNDKYHLSSEQLDEIKAKKHNWWSTFTDFYKQATALASTPYYDATLLQTVTSEMLYNDEKRILEALAGKESCVILGRTGFHIFRDNPDAFRVMLIADLKFRRENVARRLNISEGEADALINKVDRERENYTQTFAGRSRYDARNYDLVLNVANLNADDVAQLILDGIRIRQQFRATDVMSE